MEIKLRKSTAEDWLVIQKLNIELCANSYQFDKYLKLDDSLSETSIYEFKDDVTNQNKFCMIAEVENAPIGYLVGGEHNYSYRSNRRGEIFHMYTSSKYRSQGIGSMLVAEFKKWCIQKGFTHIATSAYFNDPKARHFYEKQGMTPIDIGYEGKIE